MEMRNTVPLQLAPERAWRTYLGGALLDRMQGKAGESDSHFPEEWIMSVVQARNAGREDIVEGLSRLATDSAITLKQLVEQDPNAMLGKQHVARHGPDTGVLVKLIDSSERLTIQVHPDKPAARRLFNSEYGKTECWHVLGGRDIDGQKPCVYLGFKPGITSEQWKDLFDRQDIQGMLDSMHRFEVKKGETILIEGGVPHAIGAGCFLAEIQEPTDYTIRIERVTPSGFPVADSMCHQGIGFDKMFDCFHYEGVSREEAEKRWFIPVATKRSDAGGRIDSLIGYERCPCFRLDRITVETALTVPGEGVFSGVYCIGGEGAIKTPTGDLLLNTGVQYFLPAGVENMELRADSGPLVLLHFFGPQ